MQNTIAILYDFDKTLCTKDMQEYTFIPRVQMTSDVFWAKATDLATEKKMDSILAYMYLMLERAKAARVSIKRNEFVALGKDLEFFPGVETWFERMNKYSEENGIQLEHYIISSGLREIIEGSKIYSAFREVFACEFLYDSDGNACWPKNAVNYTTKTQFLFRISKGALDISDDKTVNRHTSRTDLAIPFSNMIYIGDGLTDVPCMKLVKSYGGYSIGVYRTPVTDEVKSLLIDKRVDFLFEANYQAQSELEKTVQKIMLSMKKNTELKALSEMQRNTLS